eukprot:TRINITY_DN294_c1_g1_i12.p4 TRINITY_DN294_c1_g1~~TRINITY_DN294_c1_g1_i12.p4  ORF type:complete len:151 (+),score=30.29 TRINITY_DN294_c1_g1_i12:126-578(+)
MIKLFFQFYQQQLNLINQTQLFVVQKKRMYRVILIVCFGLFQTAFSQWGQSVSAANALAALKKNFGEAKGLAIGKDTAADATVVVTPNRVVSTASASASSGKKHYTPPKKHDPPPKKHHAPPPKKHHPPPKKHHVPPKKFHPPPTKKHGH